ncbi:hypothetical protein BKG77_15160 [Mycobacteroides chelonae]|uniref:leucine-rich repeat domain-containing protein n=1 Tax=Mycobacteroides chelonae TaxID=1774 RepID=UPI0008A9C974|nr:leucine-rich repeat domain-containing protein [Mycobacteroides chelonae]OHU24769.1 hypothetical protein BKG77_15160 [Mycobacteroides chelonae]
MPGEGLIEVTDRIPTRPIREPLTEDMFAPLQPHEKKVLLWTELDSQHLQRVADLMRPHPEVGLSVLYDAKDLDFLELFPWLKTFETGAGFYTLESIDGLRHLTQLEDLDFPATKERFSLKILEHFPYLTRLGLDHLDSKTPDLEIVAATTGLRKLGLRSCKFDNLDFLRDLPELYWLALNRGSCADLSAITSLPSLRGLVIYQTKVQDIAPAARCTQLRHLEISTASVTQLPDLSTASNLRSISLSGLKNLRDISPLLTAPALTYLITGSLNPDLAPEDYGILNNHPTLKYLHASGRNKKLDAETARITKRKPGVWEAQTEYIRTLAAAK